MDLRDVVLVIENDKGTEINMLMSLDDYKKFVSIDDMSELADQLLCLGRTLGEEGKLYRVLQGGKCNDIRKIL